MTLGPTLTTARLILRPPIFADFEPWVAFQSDPEASRYVGGVVPRAACWRAFAAMTGAWSLQGFSMFSVLERDTGRWVGRLGPWHPAGWPGDEVGWGIVRECWGRGYAFEGATAAMDFAFETVGWTDVIHVIDPQNTPSQALARRLGSTLRGPVKLPEPFHEATVEAWGQTRDQWRARRAATAPTTTSD